MKHSTSFTEIRESAGEDKEYVNEAQLTAAERKYAFARARSRRARDECHALESDLDARIEAAARARERYDAAEAKCVQLKRLIEELEERLG